MKTQWHKLLIGAVAVLGVATPVLAYVEATPVAVADTGAGAAVSQQAILHIPSMTCSNKSCETTVYLSLIRTPGVSGVRIDEGAQDVVVQYDPTKTSSAKLLVVVRNAGYPGTLVVPRKS